METTLTHTVPSEVPRNQCDLPAEPSTSSQFIPQYDKQVMGPANVPQVPIDQENPPEPDPPSKLRFDYCHKCETTWLVGKQPYSAHPSHDNGQNHQTNSLSRSLIVHIFGTCVAEEGSTRRSALAVYFGPDSPHNISRNIDTSRQTTHTAEISAAITALRYVRTIVRRQREHMIRADPTGMHFRLIVATHTRRIFEQVSRQKSH